MRRYKPLIMVLLIAVSLVISGCATTRGIGTDIKSVGQKIESISPE